MGRSAVVTHRGDVRMGVGLFRSRRRADDWTWRGRALKTEARKELHQGMNGLKVNRPLTCSSSSFNGLLNIQSATVSLVPRPRTASRTEARRLLEWREESAGGAGLAWRTWTGLGKTKFVFMVGYKEWWVRGEGPAFAIGNGGGYEGDYEGERDMGKEENEARDG